MRIGSLGVEEFVCAWQAARSPREVAELAGVAPNTASMAAMRLRLKGVHLKRFAKKRTVDVVRLNAIAEVGR